MIAALIVASMMGAYSSCVLVQDFEPDVGFRDGEECGLWWEASLINACRQQVEVNLILFYRDAEGNTLFVDDDDRVTLFGNEKTAVTGVTRHPCGVEEKVESVEVWARSSGMPT